MKVVTVHRGARDSYQVACSLHEAGMLESLVTDLYWPGSRRSTELLPSAAVECCWATGSLALACDRLRAIPFSLKRSSMRLCDRRLGRRAAEIANARDAALLSYSYYAYSAFSNFQRDRPRILFQLHPHPAAVRTILRRERGLHPECASSLDKEWELALPEHDFQRLVQESSMPDHWIVASSFTKSTLVEHGAPAERIEVIPYGVDLNWFKPEGTHRSANGPLRLLFVGTVSQRKGVKYLVDALESLPAGSAELTICGRLVDDVRILRGRRAPVHVRAFVNAGDLLREMQSSDLFVFPSLAEGFGHVLLEAMACGLPVIGTTRTAAPDLIQDGCEGFLTEPGSVPDLVRCIERFLHNRSAQRKMGMASRARAEEFSWGAFRRKLAAAVREMVAGRP